MATTFLHGGNNSKPMVQFFLFLANILVYMHWEFKNIRHRDDRVIKLGEVEVSKVKHFKYLGSIIQNDDNIENDVMHRIQARLKKWRSAT
ncbi:hypothetical protein Sjap_018391 [Stephania japonica]|uniref:Uncharacterized protein n=1 Tax=Stephania japonica TaxID=461633 RepID=A0AAP0I7V9_9MAGN